MRKTMCMAAVVTLVASVLTMGAAKAENAKDCPNEGVVRFGVEPFEVAAKMLPIYSDLGRLIGENLDCKVEVFIGTSYTAEIEAMRHKKLDIGEFGPLGYVLAHQVADAEAVAAFADKKGAPEHYFAGIVTWPGSGIKTLKGVVGKSFAFSDPASTSGHLFPAYALRSHGIDPDSDVKAIYAGSHTASYEAIRNHKVMAGELNSEQIERAKIAGSYRAGDFVQLWKSKAIPLDPICVRGDLSPAFKARLTTVLQTLDLSSLPEQDRKQLRHTSRLVPQTDAAYDQIRELVQTLRIDLSKL